MKFERLTPATGLWILCVLSAIGVQAADDLVRVDHDSIANYVRSCRKADGAFGPLDQEYTDAAWNFPAVATLKLLDATIENPAAILEHGLGFPSGHVGYGHWQFFHEHQLRKMLGQPIAPTRQQVMVAHQGFQVRYYGSPWGTDGDTFFKAIGDARPDPRDLSAETIGYYNLSSLYYVLSGLQASGRTAANRNTKTLVEFIQRRQSPSGGFVDVRTADGAPLDADAHIAHTFHAVASLRLLNAEVPHADLCAKFIASCREMSGGYRFHPQSDLPGNRADIYYTWAALWSLEKLGVRPDNADVTRHWINSLQNADGGFGDQPGWRSRLYSTFYAVDALRRLGDLKTVVETKMLPQRKPTTLVEGRWKIYQAIFKMPPCEPDDLADLQRRGLNLLALKSEKFEAVTPLLHAIRERQLPMDVVLCPEMYPHRLQRGGGVTLDHVGNFVLDPRWNERQLAIWKTADQQGRTNLPAHEYGRQVIAPLRQLGSFCYPEQDFEMEFAYSAYDAGLAGTASYNALLASFNWTPRDFVRVFPWREKYVDKLVPIADVDAHGDLKKWSPQLDHTRNLFLADGPTFADFQLAAAAGRVVCVVAQPADVASGVTFYGQQPAIDYVKKRQAEWQWWK